MSADRQDIYDLIAALDAARAVADCAMDHLSGAPNIHRLGSLITGVGQLLERAQAAAARIEQQPT